MGSNEDLLKAEKSLTELFISPILLRNSFTSGSGTVFFHSGGIPQKVFQIFENIFHVFSKRGLQNLNSTLAF